MSTSLVRAASLTHYDEVARASGLNPARMLSDAGLHPSVLHDPDLAIPVRRVGHLLQSSAVASGDESFGLRMAESRRISDLGAVGLLIRDQPRLRNLLDVLVRYHPLLNDSLALAVEECAGIVVIRLEVMVGEAAPARQAIELALGVVTRLLRQFLGADWRPRHVSFAHPAPHDASTHLRVFGPSVRFEDDFNGIVVAAPDLDARNPAADPAMARHAQKLLDASIRPRAPGLLEEVKRAIVQLLPSGRCGIEQVCDHLGLLCRTVQRRLARDGKTFSSLVDDIRRELVARYLDEGGRPLAEVAASLGFAAPSAFSRWHRARFGCSPRQARADFRCASRRAG